LGRLLGSSEANLPGSQETLEEAMKKAQVAGLLLLSCLAWGAKAADYPLVVHVRSSHLFHECDSVQFKVACGNNLHLDVVVDNKKYELDGGMADCLLRTGDYPARLVKDNAPGAFMERREFELLFPDGTGHKFKIIGEEE
jgi:hypothetical protein